MYCPNDGNPCYFPECAKPGGDCRGRWNASKQRLRYIGIKSAYTFAANAIEKAKPHGIGNKEAQEAMLAEIKEIVKRLRKQGLEIFTGT